MAELSVSATGTAPDISAAEIGDQGVAAEVRASGVPRAETPVADEAAAAAERIAFLALASELARGRNVLVVDDGASALAGIAAHLDSTGLGALAETEGGKYDLVVADLLIADDSATAGAAQLGRVVSAEHGIALVRMPNRPEFAPLLDQFTGSFARSLTLRQHNWVSSALFDDAMFENDDPSRAVAASVRKMAAAAPGEELYNVVVAAHGAFPDFRPQLALTRSPELRRVLSQLAEAREAAELARAESETRAAEQEQRIRALEEELAWYDENQLALRETVEASSFARTLLGIWVTVASNLDRVRRVLRG